MISLTENQYLLLYAFLLVIISLFYHIYKQLYWRQVSRIKGCKEAQSKAPVRDPFIGLDFIYDCLFEKPVEKYLDSTYKVFQQLGSTYICKRWTWEAIYTCDSRNIKHILASGFDDFKLPRLRVHAMAGLLGSGIFTLNGPSWSHARAVLRPCFAKQNKQDIVNMLEAHFQALLGRISNDGSSIDLQPLFFWLTMDFATDFLMGHSTHVLGRASSHAKEKQFVDDYMTCSTEIVRKMQLGPLQMFSLNFAAMRARSRVFRYIDDFISASLDRKQADESPTTGCNVLQGLAAVTTDKKQLRDQILHILVASRDTTACLLSNLFFVLSRKPHIYEKLRREVVSIAGTKPATSSQLNSMEYLKWCVQECTSKSIHPAIVSLELTVAKKPCDFIPSFPRTLERPPKTRLYRMVVVKTAVPLFSSRREILSCTTSMLCTEMPRYLALMPKSLYQKGGMVSARAGATCLSTVDQESASAVSHIPSKALLVLMLPL